MQPLADNEPGVTSALGELSNYSKTFSKEIGHYSDSEFPNVDLMSYVSRSIVNDVSTNIKVPSDQQRQLMVICNWMYSQCVSGLFDNNVGSFTSAILTEFSAEIDSFECGDMVQADTNLWLPEWISYTLRTHSDDNVVKVWFSDASFRLQYDEYELVVVPPIDTIDDLFQEPAIVKVLLDQYSFSERLERIETAKESNPETKVRNVEYDWTNPSKPEIQLGTNWSIIIYGPAGDNIDAIKVAISNWILENSAHVKEDWIDWIPDVFKSTEYIIIPVWDNFSIPNETLVTGLYSPTIGLGDLNRLITTAKSEVLDYPDAHVDSYIEYTVANHRSIGFLAVGSPENRDSIYTFKERWEDYFVVPTSMPDFGRMSPDTQNFIILLGRLLSVADRATEFSEIPSDMTKLVRGDVLYITKSFNDVQYVVMTRASFEDKFTV